MDHLLVMKFGGTSVGSAARMNAACDLIAGQAANRPVAAVVSAMSKITDLLLDTTRMAEADDQDGIDRNLALLTTRHLEAAKDLIPPSELDRVNGEIADLLERTPAHRQRNADAGGIEPVRAPWMKRLPWVSGFPP